MVPDFYQAMIALDAAVRPPGWTRKLANLVRIRASQLNGCAYCRTCTRSTPATSGDTEQRMYLLPVWREARKFYTEQEQAALELTEAITLISVDHVPDEVYEIAANAFEEKELAQLIALDHHHQHLDPGRGHRADGARPLQAELSGHDSRSLPGAAPRRLLPWCCRTRGIRSAPGSIAEAGYPAIATSSGAVARVIGYDDGQLTPPAEMFTAVARIARAVEVPVTADMEAGYGLPPKEFVERVLETGAVGCNLEDSVDREMVEVQRSRRTTWPKYGRSPERTW